MPGGSSNNNSQLSPNHEQNSSSSNLNNTSTNSNGEVSIKHEPGTLLENGIKHSHHISINSSQSAASSSSVPPTQTSSISSSNSNPQSASSGFMPQIPFSNLYAQSKIFFYLMQFSFRKREYLEKEKINFVTYF
jgi:hypothetical protein